jgi:PIN domain nuclease of toxin-antitoxin system
MAVGDSMKAYVIDTHILWWYISGNVKKLNRAARRAFEEGENRRAILYVPVITLVEIWDVNHNHGYPFDFRSILQMLQQTAQFVFVPFDVDDVEAYSELAAIPQSRDRMIAAACRKMAAPLLTVDQEIIDSGVVEVIQ